MAAALSILALGACVAPGPTAPSAAGAARAPLRVMNGGQPFAYDQGAAARKVAEAQCAAQGRRLVPSIYDRFEAGAWVYVGGCA